MNLGTLRSSLSKIFTCDYHRIVFWHDPDQEFLETFPQLDLEGVTLLNIQDESLLELKVRLETQDTSGKHLLYSPAPEPEPEKDWLLDIRLYSRSFHADRASLLLNELGLTSQSMRAHVSERKKFFKNQDRLNRLKKLVSPEDREKDIDLKILAVITAPKKD